MQIIQYRLPRCLNEPSTTCTKTTEGLLLPLIVTGGLKMTTIAVPLGNPLIRVTLLSIGNCNFPSFSLNPPWIRLIAWHRLHSNSAREWSCREAVRKAKGNLRQRNRKSKLVKKFLSEGFALVMIGVALVFVPIRGHLSTGKVSLELAVAHPERENSSEYEIPEWLDATEQAFHRMAVVIRPVGERK